MMTVPLATVASQIPATCLGSTRPYQMPVPARLLSGGGAVAGGVEISTLADDGDDDGDGGGGGGEGTWRNPGGR